MVLAGAAPVTTVPRGSARAAPSRVGLEAGEAAWAADAAVRPSIAHGARTETAARTTPLPLRRMVPSPRSLVPEPARAEGVALAPRSPCLHRRFKPPPRRPA